MRLNYFFPYLWPLCISCCVFGVAWETWVAKDTFFKWTWGHCGEWGLNANKWKDAIPLGVPLLRMLFFCIHFVDRSLSCFLLSKILLQPMINGKIAFCKYHCSATCLLLLAEVPKFSALCPQPALPPSLLQALSLSQKAQHLQMHWPWKRCAQIKLLQLEGSCQFGCQICSILCQ